MPAKHPTRRVWEEAEAAGFEHGLAALLFVTLGLPQQLWQLGDIRRDPMRLNKNFLNRLLHSEPIAPKHDPTKAG
jgi:hypothetical protein